MEVAPGTARSPNLRTRVYEPHGARTGVPKWMPSFRLGGALTETPEQDEWNRKVPELVLPEWQPALAA